MKGFSRLFDRALVLAAIVHHNEPRKGTAIPYVIHPVHVATILLRHGYSETLAVAGLLHDVLEDIDYDNGRGQLAVRSAFPRSGLPDAILPAQAFQAAFDAFIDAEFPAEVLSLVRAVTEPQGGGTAQRSWAERKADTLAHLATAPHDVVVLKSADALHNVRSIVEDIDHHGATVLGRFKGSPGDTLWYYEGVAERSRSRLDDAPIALELTEATRALAAIVRSL
jgi:(p)ppGpp synthase/HD superfamily hydrolase